MGIAPSDTVGRKALEQSTRTEVCRCGKPLSVAFFDGLLRLRCPDHGYDVETVPKDTSSTLRRWRRGEQLNAIERMQTENLLHKKINAAESNGIEPDPRWSGWLAELENPNMNNKLATYKPAAIITQDEATRFIDMAKLDGMTPGLRQMAVEIMTATGLNPILGEVMIYEKKVYVTVDGFRKLLNASGTFDGMEPPHYLDKNERAAQGYADDDVVVRVAMYRKGQRMPVYGVGKANPNKPFRGNQVERTHPQIMAENRAMRRAARQGWQDILSGYNINLDPMLEDDADFARDRGNYIEGSAREVDQQTGEILDAPQPDFIPDDIPTEGPEEAPAALFDSGPAPSQKNIINAEVVRLKWGKERLVGYTQDTYGVEPGALTYAQAEEVVGYLKAIKPQANDRAGRLI